MTERTLYYWSPEMFSSSINSGDSYKKLPQTIVISILNYPLFPSESDRFHTVFHIREDEEGFLWSDRLEFHAIDLSTFMVQWRKYRRTLMNKKQQEMPWLMMLSAADYRKDHTNNEMLMELEEWAMKIDQVREALIEWENLSVNKENRMEYEARMKELRDLLSNFEGEREAGIEEGIEIGIQKGIQQIATKLLDEGMPLLKIAELTGLSEEEIKNLG